MPETTVRRSLFREVNDQISRVNAGFEAPDDEVSLICECEQQGCVERLQVPVEVWEELRHDCDGRFVVLPGHEGAAERVVADDGYSIVRLRGADVIALPTRLPDPLPAA